MMKWSIVGLLLLGVVAAVSATFLVSVLVSEPTRVVAASPEAPEALEVLVASRELAPLAVVGRDAVARKQIGSRDVPAGALVEPVQVLGRVLARPMVEGQVYSESCFAPSLPFPLADGHRAASLSLGCAELGLARPGSLVDVMVGCSGVAGNSPASRTLLSRILVLAVDGQGAAVEERGADGVCGSGAARRRIVTLMVDRAGAETLQSVKEQCSVSLVLRNAHDPEEVELASAAEPAAQAEVVPVPAESPPQWKVKINRGGTVKIETFPLAPPGSFPVAGSEPEGTP